MRDHEPIEITEFNGLWKRGDRESTPEDHFSDCNNIEFIESGFQSRPGIAALDIDDACDNLQNVVRMYTYLRPDRQSLLVLDASGNVYDTGSPTPCTPILTIAGMTDFAFQAWAGRAYISPHDGVMGLNGEFLYVYLGYGAAARKAAGLAPTGAMTGANGDPINTKLQAGYHIFAVVFETDTGFLTKLGGNVAFLATGAHKCTLTNIPISPQTFVTKRHIVTTKTIDPLTFTGDLENYQFFFVPNAILNDNTTTTLADIDFYDADLLEDASYLSDLLEEIPAGVNLSLYHGRLISMTEFGQANSDPLLDTSGNISLARVSEPGEPEAFNAVSGLIIAPIDGNPLTNAQEYRDNLYFFKNTRTISYTDNDDVPSSWEPVYIDNGIGCPIHGLALVLDSGGSNVDYLIMADYSGVILFNGGYIRPELSWKIQSLWLDLDRDLFQDIQVLNDSISQRLYMTLPDGTLLYADYGDGMNPKDIKWAPWTSDLFITTIALINTNTLAIGSLEEQP